MSQMDFVKYFFIYQILFFEWLLQISIFVMPENSKSAMSFPEIGLPRKFANLF